MNDIFFIKNISIEGLFGEKDINWDLNRDVNILGGINGSGKSTVIKNTFLFINDLSLENTENINSFTVTFENNWVLEIRRIINKNLDFPAAGVSAQVNVEKVYKSSKNDLIDATYFYIKNDRGDFVDPEVYKKLIKVSFLSSAEQEIISDEIVKGIGNKKIKTSLDLSLYKEINRRNELITNKSLDGSLSLIQSTIHIFYKIMNDFFKDTDKSLTQSSSFDFQHNHKEISCYNLSTGEKQLLLIFLTVFNTNGEPYIVLMDEPDLGIHIDWKKKLIKSIMMINPNIQLILSTHSPSMLEGYFDKVIEMNEISKNIQ